MSDLSLLALRKRPPRFGGGDNWGGRLRIGLLIDWLDARPEHSTADLRVLRRKAERGDVVAAAAGVLSSRLGPEGYAAELDIFGRYDHWAGYGVGYHAGVVGHLHDDEMPVGESTYRRLYAVMPDCLSGLVNLAEVERRAGNIDGAARLLGTALDRATSSSSVRHHHVRDSAWAISVRCALARLAPEPGVESDLLDLAQPAWVVDLAQRLRDYGSWDAAALPAHRAFAVASSDQRIALHAAMRLAPIDPEPPPSAHANFEAMDRVEALVLRASTRR